jgi:hypothetical protein
LPLAVISVPSARAFARRSFRCLGHSFGAGHGGWMPIAYFFLESAPNFCNLLHVQFKKNVVAPFFHIPDKEVFFLQKLT